MFKRFTIQWWRFWRAGEGLSIKTGRALVLCALTGLAAGFAAVGFYWLLDVAKHLLMTGCGHYAPPMAAGEVSVLRGHLPETPVGEPLRWVLLFLPMAGALASALIVKLAPSAAGHGTDSVILSYHRRFGYIAPKAVPVKAIASALIIGSGGSAGAEGPITQIGAGCGSIITSLLNLTHSERRLLMAAGMAAGVGALFRAPLAGAIFAAEVLYSGLDFEFEVLIPSMVASTIAYTVYALFYGWQPLFEMVHFGFDDGLKLFPYLVLALVVSLGAKLYILIFRKSESFFRNWKLPDWLKPAIGGLLTGILGFFLPQVMGAGYGLIQQTLVVDSALAERFGELSIPILFAIFIGKIVATSFSVGSGGSGGLFGPALVAGSALGAFTGLVMTRLFPAMNLHPGSFAMVGMAGFLAASVRTPIAAIIMVSEITGNHGLLIPTMWVCGITYWIGNGWTIYRSQVRTRDCSPAHTR